MGSTTTQKKKRLCFRRKRIRRRQLFVYQQENADQYSKIAEIPTKAGAGTSFWSPELNRYYVAAPAHNGEQASILVFQPQP